MALLSGIVEVDETYMGGKEMNKHSNKKLYAGRGMVGKTPVIGMRERGGRVKAKALKSTGAKSIKAEVMNTVEFGSTLCTDDFAAYNGLEKQYRRKIVNHSAREYVNGMAHTNSIESVWALLKRGYYGTYHNFTVKHMQRYVDEVAYRLNEGNCKIPTLDRMDALVAKSVGVRLTYESLTA